MDPGTGGSQHGERALARAPPPGAIHIDTDGALKFSASGRTLDSAIAPNRARCALVIVRLTPEMTWIGVRVGIKHTRREQVEQPNDAGPDPVRVRILLSPAMAER